MSLEWRPVVGHEAFYEVSNEGHVRRIGRVKGARVGRCLNHAWQRRTGYYFVILCCAMKKRTAPVHTLVAQAFIGPRPDGHEINHKDCNKRNNRVENLEYVTKSENALHAVAMGAHRWSKPNRLMTAVKACQCSHCRWLLARVEDQPQQVSA